MDRAEGTIALLFSPTVIIVRFMMNDPMEWPWQCAKLWAEREAREEAERKASEAREDRSFTNLLSKSEQIFKKTENVSTEVMNIEIFSLRKFSTPQKFSNFSHQRKIFIFGIFLRSRN